MTVRVTVLSVIVFATHIVAVAQAQPYAWVPHSSLGPASLSVIDLSRAEELFRMSAPLNVRLGKGTFTPDRSTYLLATSVGVARFDVATHAFLGLLGEAIDADAVWVSPNGRWAHVAYHRDPTTFLTRRYRILDAQSGATVHDECCAAVIDIAFRSDDTRYVARRMGTTLSVSSYADAPTAAARWTVASESTTTQIGMILRTTPNGIALVRPYDVPSVGVGSELMLLNPLNGAVDRRATGAALLAGGTDVTLTTIESIAVAADELFALVGGRFLVRLDRDLTRLAAMDVTNPVPSRGSPTINREIVLSHDGSRLYLFRAVGLGTHYAVHETLALRRLHVVGLVPLGGVINATLTTDTPCTFEVPVSVPFPVDGGVEDLPVVATSSCRPWTVRNELGTPRYALLNPGTYSGSAVLRVAAAANPFTAPAIGGMSLFGRSVGFTQPAETRTPGAPLMRVGVEANRQIRLSWTPGPDPDPIDYRIWGARRGQPLSLLAAVSGTTRAWTSDPLAPGSYFFEITAVNHIGATPSNRIEISVDETGIPFPPTNLTASIADDVLALQWRPAPLGTAPASYVIEAATAGSAAFAPVVSTIEPTLRVTRVPRGSWQVRVRSQTLGGVSEPSNVVTFSSAACTTPPSAPLSPSFQISGSLLTVQWLAPVNGGAEQYVIEAGSTAGSFDLGRIVVSSHETFFEANVPRGVYFVRIRARNACGDSAASTELVVVAL